METEITIETNDKVEADHISRDDETSENATSDNDVAIAAIEADAQVKIAEVNAEARIAEADAYSDNKTESDTSWPTIQLNNLEQKIESLDQTVRGMLSTLSGMQKERTLLETETETEAEAETEVTGLTQASTLVETVETPTVVTEKSAVESQPAQIEKSPTIKLV